MLLYEATGEKWTKIDEGFILAQYNGLGNKDFLKSQIKDKSDIEPKIKWKIIKRGHACKEGAKSCWLRLKILCQTEISDQNELVAKCQLETNSFFFFLIYCQTS